MNIFCINKFIEKLHILQTKEYSEAVLTELKIA